MLIAMIYRALADAVLIVHLCFVPFVVLGGLVVLRWPRVAWLHVPAVLWGIYIELSGRICPLTPLENSLRERGGESGYTGGFIEHYITALIYPDGLTSTRSRSCLASLVFAVNATALLVGRPAVHAAGSAATATTTATAIIP